MTYAYDFVDGWLIRDRAGYVPDDEVSKATVFALANGYTSSRGASEFLPADAPGVAGHYVNGLYDSPSGGILDREMINLPAWTPLALAVDGEALDLAAPGLGRYSRALDLRRALLVQSYRWRTRRGVTVTLDSERLVSAGRLHLGAIQWRLRAGAPCAVTLRSSVDARVSNRFAATHFAQIDVIPWDAGGAVTVATIEEGYRAVVAAAHQLAGAPDAVWRASASDERLNCTLALDLMPGQDVTLTKLAAIYDSRFSAGDLLALARDELRRAEEDGYDTIRAEHARAWAALWDVSDVVIEGDPDAQMAIRFCLYHLLANLPHDERVSVSARGLQGQDYWGSIFWDNEIYVLPFYTYTQPAYARRSLIYRAHTLPGAQRKAAGLGYAGAYYAWQSQETGDETCALYVFDNPLTGEKIRSYFADEQIHISADVVYALWQYVEATGDAAFLRDYGLPIAVEVARFFASRVAYDEAQGRYELRTVLGPDEYHERVDNNAYTNALARRSLEIALGALDGLRERDPDAFAALRARLALDETEIARWREVAARLTVPAPDPVTGLIEQFDGYFALEDAPPDEVRARLAHPDLHPGGPLGPFQATQAIKQADAVLLLFLLRERFTEAVKRANWEYYEPRTAHDSSLSPMAYALVAADIGLTDWAYRYFMQTAMMDLLGTGPHWNFGVHTAAMGGAWQAIVRGFCRLELASEGARLLGWPKLPAHWKRVAFSFFWHGNRVRFSADGRRTTLRNEGETVPLIAPDGARTLGPGAALALDHAPRAPQL